MFMEKKLTSQLNRKLLRFTRGLNMTMIHIIQCHVMENTIIIWNVKNLI